jgi:hypothetical protein
MLSTVEKNGITELLISVSFNILTTWDGTIGFLFKTELNNAQNFLKAISVFLIAFSSKLSIYSTALHTFVCMIDHEICKLNEKQSNESSRPIIQWQSSNVAASHKSNNEQIDYTSKINEPRIHRLPNGIEIPSRISIKNNSSKLTSSQFSSHNTALESESCVRFMAHLRKVCLV